jgi:FtsP/CotA-like multicopper oxidase with cupredoxin domain
MDQKNPRTSTIFYITEEGHEPAAFDPSAPPNITVRQGGVEDWVIENRSQEIHTFHIHQTHFLLLERDGNAVDEPYLRDGVAVPYWDGVSKEYPSVKIRIDFRDPEIIGTFPYHCHILQHEDGGMMGTIQVVSAK